MMFAQAHMKINRPSSLGRLQVGHNSIISSSLLNTYGSISNSLKRMYFIFIAKAKMTLQFHKSQLLVFKYIILKNSTDF